MRNRIIQLLALIAISVSLCGCRLLGESDEALMRQIRLDLVESTRPALVNALDKARGHDNMIDPLRTEKVKTVDRMILSIERVYPNTDEEGNLTPYSPAPMPWEN